MTTPQILLQTLETALADWQVFGRRAQLDAAMPALDALNQRRVAYSVLATLLSERGLVIKPEALRQALHRWRARQASLPETSTAAASLIAAPAGAAHLATPAAGSVGPSGVSTVPRGQSNSIRTPLTKADLQDLRKKPVDLDAIIKESRKLQKQS